MKKVVVIGGGFAGSCVTKKLEKEFDVTLIDSKDYFEFTPGVLRTIVEPTHIKKIQVLHTHYLKKAKLILGNVKEASHEYVKINNKKINFDYLAISSGSSYNTPFKEKDIIITARAKNLRDSHEKLEKAKKILIIGGGLVGVELAAEICTHYKDKEITIIHAKDKLIERNHEKAVKYAENFLKNKGIDIIYNERVIKTKKALFTTDKGNKIKADLAFLCTGITPNFSFMKKNFSSSLNEKNQIKVNSYLQLINKTSYNNIFVAGDITDINIEKTAQNAINQAKTLVNNIKALENNKPLFAYQAKQTPLVISLGKYNGIFSWGKFVFTGLIPGILKTLIEKREMWKYKS